MEITEDNRILVCSPESAHPTVVNYLGKFRSKYFYNEHTDRVNSFALSPSGNYVVSVSGDGSRNCGNMISMLKGTEVFGIDRFASMNNRPDILLRTLGSTGADLMRHYFLCGRIGPHRGAWDGRKALQHDLKS